MDDYYLWLKAAHVIAVIAWMAGMLYLPRLYVYHAGVGPGPQAEIFKIMERRLLRAIINPAMIAAWILGLGLAWHKDLLGPGFWGAGWFETKLALLMVMQIVHAALARFRRQFARDANRHSPRFYRIVNETVTGLLVAIVILAVVKPF